LPLPGLVLARANALHLLRWESLSEPVDAAAHSRSGTWREPSRGLAGTVPDAVALCRRRGHIDANSGSPHPARRAQAPPAERQVGALHEAPEGDQLGSRGQAVQKCGEQWRKHPRSRRQHQPRRPTVVATSSGARARVSVREPGPAPARLGPRPAARAPATPRVARAALDPRLARPCKCGVGCRSPLPGHQVYSPFA
jgi:hypothetical protein